MNNGTKKEDFPAKDERSTEVGKNKPHREVTDSFCPFVMSSNVDFNSQGERNEEVGLGCTNRPLTDSVLVCLHQISTQINTFTYITVV